MISPVSSNFYGWAKASYELLGWPYACGTFGRRLEFVMVRIGHPTPVNAERHMAEDPGLPPAGSGIANFKRNLACYFSPRDLRQLFRKAVEGEDVSANGEVPFAIVYGISNNTRAFWSLDSARQVIGYEPEDDSEVVYARGCPALSDRWRGAGRPRRGLSDYLKRPVIPVKTGICLKRPVIPVKTGICGERETGSTTFGVVTKGCSRISRAFCGQSCHGRLSLARGPGCPGPTRQRS